MDAGFDYAERSSLELFGREIPQILLIHCNELNAVTLRESIDRMRRRAYTFITLDEAMGDPVYQRLDRFAGPGGSWLSRSATVMGRQLSAETSAARPVVPKWITDLRHQLLAQPGAGAKEALGHTPVPIMAADLEWVDLDPAGAPGVKIANLWGQHEKGAFGALFKLPAGFAAPLHTHTRDMRLVIVSGTYIQGPEGKPEFRLGPGSYPMQPGGTYRHATRCDTVSACVFFVESDGAFDLHPAAARNPPAPT